MSEALEERFFSLMRKLQTSKGSKTSEFQHWCEETRCWKKYGIGNIQVAQNIDPPMLFTTIFSGSATLFHLREDIPHLLS